MKFFSSLVVAALLVSSVSFAGNDSYKQSSSKVDYSKIDEAFDRLKDVGVDLQPTGTICEYLAKETIERKFSPDQFEIVLGIQYGEFKNAVGELDVTVIDREFSQVVYVAEVKCWKNPASGLKKAKEQLSRFMNYLNGRRVNWMKILAPGYDSLHVESADFQNQFDVGYIAQKGSRKSGYTTELDFTLREAMKLRARIMECQDAGECKRPAN